MQNLQKALNRNEKFIFIVTGEEIPFIFILLK